MAVSRRLREVRQALHRIAWNEYEREPEAFEGDEYAALVHELETEVTRECLADSFCAEPLDDHIARLALSLGLPAEAVETWRELPDPPPQVFFDWSADDADPDSG